MKEQSKNPDSGNSNISNKGIKSLSPEVIRREGNRLKDEKSEYLKQHAHNPMDWYPWSDEALARARAEDKPIFLSIGYSSCHWCHVMEEQVFTSDDIALFMNEHFINIKVDREERPDIDAVYMEAVRAMTGGGGWPMSVFLTPDLEPFYGGTYFPHDQFLYLARQINQAYTENREKIAETASKLAEILSQDLKLSGSSELTAEIVKAQAEKSKSFYDSQRGGFTGRMKFPTPIRWQFLLHYYRKTGDPELAEMIRRTLDTMGSGGIHDHIGGGFHRYTVDDSWTVPHFEKMLYDNAQLASLYLEASVVFDDRDYAAIGRSTLDFMIDSMSGDKGAFYASYDADSDGEEGLFYVWTFDEIEQIAGDDTEALSKILGITKVGNFEGKNVITRRMEAATVANELGIEKSYADRLFSKYHKALKEYRSKRNGPNLDKKIVVSWNGLAISAMANAYGVFGDQKYREAAERAADYLWRVHHREDSSLLRSSYDGEAANDGILDDYAFFANGLIDLFQSTGKSEYLQKALQLIEYVRANFSKGVAGFYLTGKNSAAPLGRKVEVFDSVEPSGNAVMLLVMLKASAITGNVQYHDSVKRTLDAYSEIIQKAGLEMAGWQVVGLMHEGPFYEVIIAGKDKKASKGLESVFWKAFPCHAVIITMPSGGPDKKIAELIPSAKDKTAIDGKPTAYVCRFGACNLPTADPVQLKEQLLNGWKM